MRPCFPSYEPGVHGGVALVTPVWHLEGSATAIIEAMQSNQMLCAGDQTTDGNARDSTPPAPLLLLGAVGSTGDARGPTRA